MNINKIHDFEMHPSRRPKILVQTAGHVAGAVTMYRKLDVFTTYEKSQMCSLNCCGDKSISGDIKNCAKILQLKPLHPDSTSENVGGSLKPHSG